MSRMEARVEVEMRIRIRRRETGVWANPDVDTIVDGR